MLGPSSPPPLRRAVGLLAAAALVLGLSACGGDEDVSADTFQEQLLARVNPTGDDAEVVMPESVAECFTQKVYDEFDQAEINRIYHAADEDELGNETRDTLAAFNAQCYEAEGAADAGGDDADTSTTEAEGDDTTTTAAEGDESTTTEG